MFSYSPPKKNLAVYKITSQTNVETGTPQRTIWRMRIACWIIKSTNTSSKHVILIAATMVTRTHRNVRLYLHCLCCSVLRQNYVMKVQMLMRK